jgi:hypothetical protein
MGFHRGSLLKPDVILEMSFSTTTNGDLDKSVPKK